MTEPKTPDHDLLIEIKTKVELLLLQGAKYVTHEEFRPVRNVVYGAVGLACSAVVVALFAMVVK